MSVSVEISAGPLPPCNPTACEGAGAVLVFDGIVRPTENDRPILALDYEVYHPMARTLLTQLAEELLHKHSLLAIDVEHSEGRVRSGECSFRLQVCSAHRKEALAAMDEFIDRLKQDVPIWKTAVYANDE